MSKDPPDFVALASLRHGPPDAKVALAEIRRIYFATTARTIEHDFAHAIDLLKRLESEDEREKAAVFMHGLSEMRREWARRGAKRKTGTAPRERKRRG